MTTCSHIRRLSCLSVSFQVPREEVVPSQKSEGPGLAETLPRVKTAELLVAPVRPEMMNSGAFDAVARDASLIPVPLIRKKVCIVTVSVLSVEVYGALCDIDFFVKPTLMT